MLRIKYTENGPWIEIKEGAPAVAAACSGADARTSGCGAISGDPQRSGDSPVKVSDGFAWLDDQPRLHLIHAGIAKRLLEEVRRLEQLVYSKPTETA